LSYRTRPRSSRCSKSIRSSWYSRDTHINERVNWKGIDFITTGAVSGNWWKVLASAFRRATPCWTSRATKSRGDLRVTGGMLRRRRDGICVHALRSAQARRTLHSYSHQRRRIIPSSAKRCWHLPAPSDAWNGPRRAGDVVRSKYSIVLKPHDDPPACRPTSVPRFRAILSSVTLCYGRRRGRGRESSWGLAFVFQGTSNIDQTGCGQGFRSQNLRSFRYLVYLNNGASGERVVKTIDLFDQKRAP
jgi:hypothetical protein